MSNADPQACIISASSSPAFFDETRDAEGDLRPHWSLLRRLLEESPEDQLTARSDAIHRHLGELGATYNVYTDAQGQERPWALDPIPFVLAPSEWAGIESGLIQRTRLLNLLLCDLYGEQRMLREGLLPPDLVYGSPSFLRPCLGQPIPGGQPLVLHAVNLARNADGRWCVLSDRVQSPSGLGYALANRIVLSRVLPDEFRGGHVQRLAGFFMALRESLRSLAHENCDAPTIALLTPGPFNETYFEHAFLARYLGFPLVEGGDLAERDGHICIRTLEGLRQVDVLLRRVDDDYCDPLELKSDSCLGVPGLLDAVRSRRIALVNSLGAAWLESPALAPFLPRLCLALLGEELALPCADSWWCGQDKERRFVRENLERLVIKRTFGGGRGPHLFGSRLSSEAREALLRELEFDGGSFVAQVPVPLSRAPILGDHGLEDRPLVLRTFVCATPAGASVLAGGLTRAATDSDFTSVSMQGGGISKDTWVVSDTPVADLSLLRPPTRVIRLERAPSEVPSRVADNLFWLGRYAERLEDICRILRCVLSRVSSEASSEQTPELEALVRLLVSIDVFSKELLGHRSIASVERECHRLIFHTHRLGTVREIQGRLQTLAFSLRDRFSADTQRTLNLLNAGLRASSPATSQPLAALDSLNHCLLHLAAFSGLEMENMTRGHAWRFLDMGRRLERAVNIVTLLQAGLLTRNDIDGCVLPAILEIADSAMTYRRLTFSQPQWPTVADLLIAEERNPRSFTFQIGALIAHLQNLPPSPADGASTRREARDLAVLRRRLARLDLSELTEDGTTANLAPLIDTLGQLAAEMHQLSNAVTRRFFAHAPSARNS